jgi:hypothetical protein
MSEMTHTESPIRPVQCVCRCRTLPPTEWCKEIAYMIPKEAGTDAIEKQRPLKLQESLKKVTVGIRKDRVARAWERLGVCDAIQFAFLRGRSTIQPRR